MILNGFRLQWFEQLDIKDWMVKWRLSTWNSEEARWFWDKAPAIICWFVWKEGNDSLFREKEMG